MKRKLGFSCGVSRKSLWFECPFLQWLFTQCPVILKKNKCVYCDVSLILSHLHITNFVPPFMDPQKWQKTVPKTTGSKFKTNSVCSRQNFTPVNFFFTQIISVHPWQPPCLCSSGSFCLFFSFCSSLSSRPPPSPYVQALQLQLKTKHTELSRRIALQQVHSSLQCSKVLVSNGSRSQYYEKPHKWYKYCPGLCFHIQKGDLLVATDETARVRYTSGQFRCYIFLIFFYEKYFHHWSEKEKKRKNCIFFPELV